MMSSKEVKRLQKNGRRGTKSRRKEARKTKTAQTVLFKKHMDNNNGGCGGQDQ